MLVNERTNEAIDSDKMKQMRSKRIAIERTPQLKPRSLCMIRPYTHAIRVNMMMWHMGRFKGKSTILKQLFLKTFALIVICGWYSLINKGAL
jgi:hypothetical protein